MVMSKWIQLINVQGKINDFYMNGMEYYFTRLIMNNKAKRDTDCQKNHI